MFKVNDYIMYGTTGVCKVLDIKEETLMNNIKKEYYILNPVYSKDTIIKIPVDNKKISMRKIVSKEEIDLIMEDINDKDLEWIDNEKERNEQYKLMLKSGSCTELISLVKSIASNKRKKKSLGERARKSDEEIMKVAEKLINEEFATVLDIEIDEVKPYILNYIQ